MPSRKPSPPIPASSSAAADRMSHEEARSILMGLWSRKQVEAAKAGNEMVKADRLREVEALSVAMTALEVLGG